MDESTAIHPAQMPPPRTHVTVTPTSGLERAQVKWFNRLRGFGFLTRGEGTPDIFVHMETLRRFGMTELRPGQFVLVRFGPGPKGLMAAEVRPEGGPLGPLPTSGGTCIAGRCTQMAALLVVAGGRVACRRCRGRRLVAAPAQAAGEATIEIISKIRRPRLLGRTCHQRGRARARPDVPQGVAGRPRHAVRFRAGRAGRLLDAQHLHLARHDLHPRATAASCASPRIPSRSRTASSPPAARCAPCWK